MRSDRKTTKTRQAPNGKNLMATLITSMRSLVGEHFSWTQTTERTLEFKGHVGQVNLVVTFHNAHRVKEALRTCQRIFTN